MGAYPQREMQFVEVGRAAAGEIASRSSSSRRPYPPLTRRILLASRTGSVRFPIMRPGGRLPEGSGFVDVGDPGPFRLVPNARSQDQKAERAIIVGNATWPIGNRQVHSEDSSRAHPYPFPRATRLTGPGCPIMPLAPNVQAVRPRKAGVRWGRGWPFRHMDWIARSRARLKPLSKGLQ